MSRASQSDSARGKGKGANRAAYMRPAPKPLRSLWDEKKADQAAGIKGLGATRGAADTKAAGDA